MGVPLIILVLAFAAFAAEVIRSRASNLIAWGLAFWVLSILLGGGGR